MITTIKHKNITWINLTSPSVREVSEATKEFPIHELIAEELTSLTMRPKVDVYQDSLYLVLHFPPTNSSFNANGGCEVDFVIGRDFMITAHYGESPILEKITRTARKQESFREEIFQKHGGYLAFKILKEFYNFSLRQLDQIHIKINKAEKKLFDGKEKQMVKELSLLRRDILDFKRNIHPHESVLVSFEKRGKEFFGKELEHYLILLMGDYIKIKNLIDNNKETLDTLYATNESLLSIKTNEIMKILTIMAFITFPLMLLSGLFGMNTVDTPILGTKGDFWIIVGAMTSGTAAMFLFFKRKKWL